MHRLLDLFAVCAVAVVLLLPKASVDAHPALEGEALELDRVARLQDDAFRRPDDVEPALELADAFLSFQRNDFAIASLSPFVERERAGTRPVDARVHLLLSAARAERLEAAEAVAEGKQVLEACSGGEGGPRCPAGTLARLHVVAGSMQALLDNGIDPARDPQRAREAVFKVLRPSRSQFAPRPNR